MNSEFLPVGSVVLLKDAVKPVIIIGYSVVEEGKSHVWDYLGCVYPIGVIGSDKNLLFNRSDVSKILFKGYVDESGQEFLNLMKEQYQQIKKDIGMV